MTGSPTFGCAWQRYPDHKWKTIESFLRTDHPNADLRLRTRDILEMQIRHGIEEINEISTGRVSAGEQLNKIEDAEKALREFCRCFFATKPESANGFPALLHRLVILDMDNFEEFKKHALLPPSSEWARARTQLIDYRLAGDLRKLSVLIESAKCDLRDEKLGWNKSGSGRAARLRVLDRLIERAAKSYLQVHGKIPRPRKNGVEPDGPFDRYMAAVLEPLTVALKNVGRARYSWPTIMKHIEKVCASVLSPPSG